MKAITLRVLPSERCSGIFEIDDSSEDSKYIVNFLFSVAKNEYFCNPRRGATESFEAALHKINVALAEIVKHGNIRWLGKLHGTIAILRETPSISRLLVMEGFISHETMRSHISAKDLLHLKRWIAL